MTSSRKAFDKTDIVDTNSLVNCLHPNDLVPFTRKPLFLIVDSPNSTAFSVRFLMGLMCIEFRLSRNVADAFIDLYWSYRVFHEFLTNHFVASCRQPSILLPLLVIQVPIWKDFLTAYIDSYFFTHRYVSDRQSAHTVFACSTSRLRVHLWNTRAS